MGFASLQAAVRLLHHRRIKVSAGGVRVEGLLQDVRYGARMLWKSPGFTLIAIAVLALGIGGTSAMFSVVNAVLLRPLPFADANRLVYLAEESKQLKDMSISYPDFLDWQAQNHVFERIGVMQPNTFNLIGHDRPEVLSGKSVTEGFFPTLGVKAVLGRVFTPEDDRKESAPVAVISYRLWQRSFGGDPNIVGRPVTLSDKAYTVVGVLPKGFEIPGQDDDVYVAIGPQVDADLTRRGSHPGIYGFARLKPGVTVDQARAELNTIAQRLATAYPLSNAGIGVNVEVLHDNVVGNTRKPLIVLFAAVGCVLLIVCANVTNLLLAKSTSRRKEISIRRALGASRLRIVRQLLTESLVMSLAGGALGIGMAVWITRAGAEIANRLLQFTADISVDTTVLAFTAGISVFTGIIFGLAPALHSTSEGLNETLKEGGRTSSIGSRQWVRNALVVTEVALSLVLLIGAGLLIRSFARLRNLNPGFDEHNLLTAMIVIPPNTYPDDAP